MPPSGEPSPTMVIPPPPPDNRQKTSKIAVVIAVSIVLLGLAGLGWYLWQRQKPAPEPAATTTFVKTGYDDACRLVSKADVETAFSMQFEEFTKDTGRFGLTDNASSCTINEVHERTGAGALGFTSLQIIVDSFESEEVAKHKQDVMRQSVVVDGKLLDIATDVPGLGDEAFFSKNQIAGATQEYLFVRKGVRLFHFVAVKFDGIDSEKVRPQIVEVAKKAVE